MKGNLALGEPEDMSAVRKSVYSTFSVNFKSRGFSFPAPSVFVMAFLFFVFFGKVVFINVLIVGCLYVTFVVIT